MLLGALGSFAGMRNGRFFGVTPAFVDTSKKPGYTYQRPPAPADWFLAALTLRHVWASPNTVWSAIALAVYFWAPYDLSPTGAAATGGPLSAAFFAQRLPLWAALTFAYTAFWHVTLYPLGWASRPFLRGRVYNWDKLFHNLFWSLCGVAIWTAFDNVFAFLWATGRLPYMTDAEAFSTPAGVARFVGGLIAVPLWRDVHFYFAHRVSAGARVEGERERDRAVWAALLCRTRRRGALAHAARVAPCSPPLARPPPHPPAPQTLHIKALYKYCHSLHHRNTDIEPFSGLTMHPVEHLYYYACILPSLFLFNSPFLFLWNGVHLLLSPGASHSGYEDHFQSDQYHYLHHRYYECNYAGTPAAALDVAFGTFKAALNEADPANPLHDKGPDARDDAKSTLRGLPALDFVVYLAGSAACLALPALEAAKVAAGAAPRLPREAAAGYAALAGAGPVALAVLMMAATSGVASMAPGKGEFWPAAFHVVAGAALTVLPIAWMTFLALA